MMVLEGGEKAPEELTGLLSGEPRPLPLLGRVRSYAWGGHRYLRELAGLDLPADQPVAEWWLGAHPSAPSIVELAGVQCGLDALIERFPERLLGQRVVDRFGPRLPFLLKLLDVRRTLSIQAHPSRAQAEAGFARENAAGIRLDAPTRTYRDAQHKPEAQVALTPFWMLAGFREPDDLRGVLAARPELAALTERLDGFAGALSQGAPPREIARALFETVMTLPGEVVDRMVDPLLHRLAPIYRDGRIARDSPDFWAVRAAEALADQGAHHDRGVLAIYLLNLVALTPGQGTFLGPGLLHAYLDGVAVEIMASSDNVIRGGLTPKHVDVPELMQVLGFDPVMPGLLPAERLGAVEHRYVMPADEFGLSRLEFSVEAAAFSESATGPEVLVAISGEARLEWGAGSVPLGRGGAVLLPCGLDYRLLASGPALVFRAFVPDASEAPPQTTET